MDNQALLWLKNKDLKFAVVIGVREGGLYKVPRKFIQAMIHNIVSPCNMWHRRLGHLHFKVLPQLQKRVKGMLIFDFEHDSICRGCIIGNNVKKNFPSISNRYKGILDLIHLDVCGPMSSPSLNGYLYYVLFIDDFCRNSWIHFLKAKSETLRKFK